MAHQRNTTRTGTVKGDWNGATPAYYKDENWSWRTKKPEEKPCGCPAGKECEPGCFMLDRDENRSCEDDLYRRKPND